MQLFLTSDTRKCPSVKGLKLVDATTIKQYEGNEDVVALVCSRDVAQVCQHLDIPNLRLIQLFNAGFDHIDPKLLQTKGCSYAMLPMSIMLEWLSLSYMPCS